MTLWCLNCFVISQNESYQKLSLSLWITVFSCTVYLLLSLLISKVSGVWFDCLDNRNRTQDFISVQMKPIYYIHVLTVKQLIRIQWSVNLWNEPISRQTYINWSIGTHIRSDPVCNPVELGRFYQMNFSIDSFALQIHW